VRAAVGAAGPADDLALMTRNDWQAWTVTVGLVLSIGGLAHGQPPPTPAKPAAPTAAAPTTLTVAGDVATPLTLSAADLKTLPRTKVEAKDEGRLVTYEGVLVGEILKKAGVPLGENLRGNAVATYVKASATDGYQVVFSLPELDNAFTSNDIIVADTIDGKPLFAYQGPWRIVAPKDSRGARSIRMLERLEVVRLRK
jgi:DMSO/TMAO reductase YedYZ molybdopterin-dependent catalytic subunit